MGIVVRQFEVLESEVEQVVHRLVETHRRKRAWFTLQLRIDLFEMIEIDVRITERVHEGTRLHVHDLGDHHRQQGVRGDVERDSQKKICTALVQLARQPAVDDVELEEGVAWSEGHAIDVSNVPGADDESA